MDLRNILIALIIIFCMFVDAPIYGQNVKILTLEKVLEASKYSVEAQVKKNLFLTKYWVHQQNRATSLPQVELNLVPITFNRDVTQRYDAVTNTDVFRTRQTLNSYGQILINQVIKPIGATLFVESNLARLSSDNSVSDIVNFNATPFAIGWQQPIFAYNDYKWQNKLAPMNFELAKKELIHSLLEVDTKTVSLFFEVCLSNVRFNIVREEHATANLLYDMAQKRFELATIEKQELLSLESNVYTTSRDLIETELSLEKAIIELCTFLGWPRLDLRTEIPSIIEHVGINPEQAISLAFSNNPHILALNVDRLESERQLDLTTKQGGLSVLLNASFGLNQQSDALRNAYVDLFSQNRITLSVRIPLLSWGYNNSLRRIAQKDLESIDIVNRNALISFEKELRFKVMEFNAQLKATENIQKAAFVAKEYYDLVKENFKAGKSSVINLNDARLNFISSEESYIRSLANYWTLYFELRTLTQYDFMSNTTLTEDLDQIITTANE